MREWFSYVQWHTFIGAFFLGTMFVALCMFIIDDNWVERFQGLISAAAAITAAMYTVSVTILHREQDRFDRDRQAIDDLLGLIHGGNAFDDVITFRDAATKLKYIPREVSEFLYGTAIAKQQSNATDMAFAVEVGFCEGAAMDWLYTCKRNGRYVPFRTNYNPDQVFLQILGRRDQQ
ncbi:hypothetical protein [Kordiimonas lacus]|uniref:Uncharacterized protein n=1 Tax=Kordiimonas lacus TaxID=637679 RepID=A0A1G7B2D3_9PROT|nr:hypothetical protein [Kordiimonas lacus]SDE20405.1 hypothetical protein SAMN04488071_2296 [Kordiimonas lacus]